MINNPILSGHRPLPSDIEAERSILGIVLKNERAIELVKEVLSPDDFSRHSHRFIFRRMLDLNVQHKKIDPSTLNSVLNHHDELYLVGGPSYISSLIKSVPPVENIRIYSRIVRDKSVLRKLISASNEIVSNALEEGVDVNAIATSAAQMMLSISGQNMHPPFDHVSDLLKESYEAISLISGKLESAATLSTGFSDLDRLTAGLHPDDLIIFASRPNLGKTSLYLQIAAHIATGNRRPVAVFSLEMLKTQLMTRLLIIQAEVDIHRVMVGHLLPVDWERLTMAGNLLAEAPLYIDDTPAPSVMEICAKARRLKTQQGDLGLIVVDYLQLMTAYGRTQELSEICCSFKALATELNIPVIVISQLNQAMEEQPNKRPVLADLDHYGPIEQVADVVLFLYRDEVYGKTKENMGEAEIIVAKQRNGPIGTVKLTFLNRYTKFANRSERSEF